MFNPMHQIASGKENVGVVDFFRGNKFCWNFGDFYRWSAHYCKAVVDAGKEINDVIWKAVMSTGCIRTNL